MKKTHPYEDRYRRVYNAGADFWEEPIPTEELIEYLDAKRFPENIKIIEFGCGEGRDSV